MSLCQKIVTDDDDDDMTEPNSLASLLMDVNKQL